MYTEIVSFENEELEKKFNNLIKEDAYFKYHFDTIMRTFQTIKIINILKENNVYKVYFENRDVIVLVEINEYNRLSVSYIQTENNNTVLSFKDDNPHHCKITFRINNAVYDITIYNYLDDIIVDDIISKLNDKECRMENIRDIYCSIANTLDIAHSTVIITSIDGFNYLKAHHGTILYYHETIDMVDYQEDHCLKDGQYIIVRKNKNEQKDIPFVKVKKNGE